MTLLKTPKPIVIKIVQDNPYRLPPNTFYQLTRPATPALARISEPARGPVFNVRELDVDKFEQQAAEDIERATRPAPTASGTYTYPEVCRRFGWDEVPEKAHALGFPAVLGRSVSWRGQVTVHYATKAVEAWAENIQELVRETKLDK